MNYLVERTVGRHGVGTIVTDEDFAEGRALELVTMGVLSPSDCAEPNSDDVEGWKRRGRALEDENKQLRTAKGGPEREAVILDLQKENKKLKSDLAAVKNALDETRQGMVKKSEFDKVSNRLAQLERLHKTTVEELDKLKVPAK